MMPVAIGNPFEVAWSWLLSWLVSAIVDTGTTWQGIASIIAFGLVAGVVIDVTKIVPHTRWVSQVLLVYLFLALMFQVGFGLPKYWYGHTGHYANSVVSFLLLATFFVAVAVGMKVTRIARRAMLARRPRSLSRL